MTKYHRLSHLNNRNSFLTVGKLEVQTVSSFPFPKVSLLPCRGLPLLMFSCWLISCIPLYCLSFSFFFPSQHMWDLNSLIKNWFPAQEAQCKVLTMGPPGKSPDLLSLENFLKSDFHLNVDLNLFSSFKYVLTCNWKIFIEQVFGFFFFFSTWGLADMLLGASRFLFPFKRKKESYYNRVKGFTP